MNMRCPYCEGKMRKGQLHAVGAGAGLEWKEGSESLRLNTGVSTVSPGITSIRFTGFST